MRYCRFSHNGAGAYGLVESVGGSKLHHAKSFLQPPATFSDGDLEGLSSRRIDKKDRFLAEATLNGSGGAPRRLFAWGRNYREHAAELGITTSPPSR